MSWMWCVFVLSVINFLGLQGGANEANEVFVNVTYTSCLNFNFTNVSRNTIRMSKDGGTVVVFVSLYVNDTVDNVVILGNYTNRIISYGINRQKGTLSFCLINTTKEDAGTYNTTANGTIARLTVLGKPTRAMIIVKNTGEVGKTDGSLTCMSTSTSTTNGLQITYSWRVNNTIISSNDKYKIEGHGNQDIHIVVARIERVNEYICSGHEQYGQSSEFSLTSFIDPKRSPRVKMKPDVERYALFENDPITLECEVLDANPTTYNYAWIKDGSILTRQTSHKLRVVNSRRADSGEYKCSVTNGIGNAAEENILIDVLYAPDATPVIKQTPPGPIISGYNVTLTCSVSGGNPLASLSWNCSGNTNNNTSGNTISHSVDFPVNRSTNNKICTCSGSHIVTSYRPHIHHKLVVYYAPTSIPQIQQSPSGAILDGGILKLTCSVSGGNPLARLSWKCNGNITNNTSGDTASYDVEFTVDKSYNGKTCTCTASHPVMLYKPVVHKTLVVYYAPAVKPVVTTNPEGAIHSGTKVTLTCSVSGGNPLAVLSWNCSGNNNNNTSGNTASYSVDFTVDKTYNNRICTCSSSHYIPSYRPTVVHRLVVYYTPSTNPTIEQLPNQHVINGRNVTLKCYASGGNPLATLTWDCVGNSINSTSGNTALYSVEFTAYKADNNKICTCAATHPVTSYNQTVQHKLNVYYAPDVTVDALSSTYMEGDKLTLECNATGNPSDYDYTGWTHSVGGIEIQTFDTDKYADKLMLDSLSHKDVGNYRCSVTNNVPDLSGELIQNSSRNIDVKFTPIVIDYGGITAKAGSNVSAKAGIFSFPDNDIRIKWMNESGHVLENGTHVAITFQAKPINITFRNDVVVSVENYTYETTLYLTNFERHLAGLYTLMVNNSMGGANLTLNVVLSDKPVTPYGFSAKVVSSHMVTLSWTRGFNGGNDQIFTISYEKQNTNETEILKKKEKKDKDYYEEDIKNLVPSTTYYFTLTASNIEGPAHAINNTLIITTDDLPESDELSIAGPVGGAVGGTITAVVIVIVVVLFLRRYKGRDEDEGTKLEPVNREDDDEGGLKDNILYESAGPRLDNAQGATGVEYAEVKKGNKFSSKEERVQETALYTEVNKKFKTEQKGDVYANWSNKGKRTGKEKMKTNPTREDVYENMENKVGTAVTQQNGNKNKDGLQYADLVFNPTKSGAKYLIHGLEDRTIYADVDTTQKIDPLPDSDEEDSKEIKKQ